MVGMKMEEIAKAALNLLVQEELSNKDPAHSTWSLSSAGLEVRVQIHAGVFFSVVPKTSYLDSTGWSSFYSKWV